MENKFVRLAELLLDIMGENSDNPDIKMPDSIILQTAQALAEGYERGNFAENDNGAMYYAGMTEDYGGYYDTFWDSKRVKVPDEGYYPIDHVDPMYPGNRPLPTDKN